MSFWKPTKVKKVEPKPPDTGQACGALADSKNWSVESIQALAKAGWGFVDVVPALYETDYCAFGPTFGDSTAVGIPYIEYRIVAHTTDHWIMWESEPASGYSVDNLAPGAPLTLDGDIISGNVQLTWEASGNLDEDLAHYVIFRGNTSGFPLDSEHEVATSLTPGYTGPADSGSTYYRVTAVDAHGNQSPGSNELVLTTATNTPDMVSVFALHANHPNPFNPQTTIAFDLPKQTDVSLRVCDVGGRLVKVLVNGEIFEAGRHQAIWNGRDDSGRQVASGTYFYRLEAGEFSETKRMVLIK